MPGIPCASSPFLPPDNLSAVKSRWPDGWTIGAFMLAGFLFGTTIGSRGLPGYGWPVLGLQMTYVYLLPWPLLYWISLCSCNFYRALQRVREAVPTTAVI